MFSLTIIIYVLLRAILLVQSHSCHTCVENGNLFVIDAEMRADCYKIEEITMLEVKFLARTLFECDIIGPVILKARRASRTAVIRSSGGVAAVTEDYVSSTTSTPPPATIDYPSTQPSTTTIHSPTTSTPPPTTTTRVSTIPSTTTIHSPTTSTPPPTTTTRLSTIPSTTSIHPPITSPPAPTTTAHVSTLLPTSSIHVTTSTQKPTIVLSTGSVPHSSETKSYPVLTTSRYSSKIIPTAEATTTSERSATKVNDARQVPIPTKIPHYDSPESSNVVIFNKYADRITMNLLRMRKMLYRIIQKN